jgi:hypothetical protein
MSSEYKGFPTPELLKRVIVSLVFRVQGVIYQ